MLSLMLLAAVVAAEKPKMGPIEKEHKMVVEAIRGCPEATDEDEIVVCSKDRGVAEAYRLPKLDARFDMRLGPNGRTALTDRSLGASGVGSCSAVGAGGSTGCTLRGIQSWADDQKRKKAADRAYRDPN